MKHIKLFESWKDDGDLLDLVWNWLHSSGNLDDWNIEELIEVADKHKDIKKKSIEYVKKKGGKLYRGIQNVDITKGYDNAHTLESWSIDPNVSKGFGETVIEVSIDDVQDNVLLSLDVVLLDPANHAGTREEYQEFVDDMGNEHEVILKGPIHIDNPKLLENNNKELYYHASSFANTDSIKKNGLSVDLGKKEWLGNDYPKGIYMFDNKDAALKYATVILHDGEVWEIKGKDLNIKDDPESTEGSHFEGESSYYTTERIPPFKLNMLDISDDEKEEMYRKYE